MAKTMSLFTIILFSLNALAWNKIHECNNGSLVVDQGDALDENGQRRLQFILRGKAFEYLKNEGALPSSRINEKNEFINFLTTYDGEYMSFIGHQQGVQIVYRLINDNGNFHLIISKDDRTGGARGRIADWYFNDCLHF